MGDIASSHSATQNTTNQQIGVNGAGASASGGTLGKKAVQASGAGISLSFDTGNNKISAPKKVNAGGGHKNGAAASPGASIADNSSASNQAGGNIAVTIAQTDQGSVAAGENVSLAALHLAQSANDALLQSNTNATTLAAAALQTGADVAAVAVPTYAAAEIASNAINPPTVIDTGGAPGASPSNTGLIIGVVGIALSLALLMKKKPA
jgi:hypothetical protein